MRQRLHLLLAAVVVVASLPASANLFNADGTDPRRALRPGEGGFSPIVRLMNQEAVPNPNPQLVGQPGELPTGIYTMTGFMVSPCRAMSNYHSVFGSSQPSIGARVDVYISTPVGEMLVAVGTPLEGHWGEYLPGRVSGGDWVLLSVAPCIGDQTGWVAFDRVPGDLPSPPAYLTAGFPVDRRLALSIHEGCGFFFREEDTMAWRHSCAFNLGASGSPIGYFNDEGVLVVVAIQRGHRYPDRNVLLAYTDDHPNLAVGVESFIRNIFGEVYSDMAPPGTSDLCGRTTNTIQEYNSCLFSRSQETPNPAAAAFRLSDEERIRSYAEFAVAGNPTALRAILEMGLRFMASSQFEGDDALALDLLRVVSESGDGGLLSDMVARLASLASESADRAVLDLSVDALSLAVTAGNRDALAHLHALGGRFHQGIGIPADPVRAREIFAVAANAGSTEAMMSLAVSNLESRSPPNYVEALRWYRAAADLGHVGAMYALGLMYFEGNGVLPVDQRQARRWFAMAGDAGDATGAFVTAAMMEQGLGGPADAAGSARYYVLAISARLPDAIDEFRTDAAWHAVEVRRAVQQFLIDQGLLAGPPDGVIGPQTQAALTRWQNAGG